MPLSPQLIGLVMEPLWDVWEGSSRLRFMKDLERTQWQPAAAGAARRLGRLQNIVAHARQTTPYYAAAFAAAGVDETRIETLQDLTRFPILSKQDVREKQSELLSSSFRPDQLTEAKTGGSTGQALQVFCDRLCAERRNGAATLTNRWTGWQLGQPMASCWGNPVYPTSLRGKLRAFLKPQVFYLDTMVINDRALRDFAAQWRKVRPGLLFGHAHSLYELARWVRASGESLQVPAIIATSMMLVDHERAEIEKAFGTRVTDRYGCEELGLIASECERHTGMHINVESLVLEILDDQGQPVPVGQPGRIVVTDLLNYGMPLVRYDVGDAGLLSPEACACGRTWPLLAKLVGRQADFLVARNGDKVAGVSLIERTLTNFQGVDQLQIVQTGPLEFILNLVKGPGYCAADEQGILDELRESLGEVTVTIAYQDRIAREPSGKFRFAKCLLTDSAT